MIEGLYWNFVPSHSIPWFFDRAGLDKAKKELAASIRKGVAFARKWAGVSRYDSSFLISQFLKISVGHWEVDAKYDYPHWSSVAIIRWKE